MRVRLKLFSKWGISFNEEDPYTVADKGGRKVVYKLSNRIDTQLAVDTLNLAIANRRKSAGIIFHSDRGAQFTSK